MRKYYETEQYWRWFDRESECAQERVRSIIHNKVAALKNPFLRKEILAEFELK
jgi:hypothetical protein